MEFILSTLNNPNKQIIFFDSSMKIDDLKNFSLQNFTLFSFDYESHQILSQNNIPHKISDDYITQNDLRNIEISSMKLSNWYQELQISKFLQYSGMNLGELFYVETYYLLIKFLKKYLEIKSISKTFKNFSFYVSTDLFSIIKSFTDSVIEIPVFHQDNFNELVQIPLRIGRKNPFSKLPGFDLLFNLSTNKQDAIEIISERLTKRINKADIKKNNKTILLYNITAQKFSDFYSQIPNFPLNMIKFDTNLPAYWNYKTYSIVKKSGSIVENYETLLDDTLEKKISESIENFHNTLNPLTNFDDFFQTFFQIENHSFWNSFKFLFSKFCTEKFSQSIKQIEITKKLVEKYNFSTIMLWSEDRFEEQILYNLAKQNKISVIFSQHGFEFDTNEMIPYMTFFRWFPSRSDFIIVWGNMMKEWFIKNGVDAEKIKSLGSPYFSKIFSTKFKFKNDYILLACDAKAFDYVPEELCVKNILEYKNKIKKICQIVTNLNEKLVIKPHPSKYSDEKKIAKEVGKNIKVVMGGDILPLIPPSSIVITTNITTAIIQVLILKKPVILIRTNSYYGKPDVLNLNGCIEANLENLESILKKLLSDKKYMNDIVKSGNNFLSKYLSNTTNSSKEILKFLSEEKFESR
jgi:hypothetical protein